MPMQLLFGYLHMDNGEWATTPIELGSTCLLKAKPSVKSPRSFILFINIDRENAFSFPGMLNK
ncbi:hypothetical protein JH26_10180 [Microvirga sp. BSC39]|nr:hypothetical protein JH26_10180 [Microvirga sp. BSC39]